MVQVTSTTVPSKTSVVDMNPKSGAVNVGQSGEVKHSQKELHEHGMYEKTNTLTGQHYNE